MTFAAHGVHLGLPTYYATGSWELALAVGLLAASPDILCAHETIHGNYEHLYQKTHDINWWPWYLKPFVFFHLISDKWGHRPDPPYGWLPRMYYAEALTWIIVGGLSINGLTIVRLLSALSALR